jgi:uncharacterized protein involved in outer membrane biogenesis
MKLVIKILIWAVSLVISIYLVAALILAFFISPDTYNKVISHYTENIPGLQIRVGGNTHVSIFPSLAVNLANVSIKQRNPGSAYQYTATADQLKLNMAILPLLRGHISPSLLVLKNAKINIEKIKSTTTGASTSITRPNKDSQQNRRGSTGNGGDKTEIQLPKIEVTNGYLSFNDKIQNKKIQLKQLNFTIIPLTSSSRFNIKLNASYSSSDQKPLPFLFSSTITVNKNVIALKPLKLSVKKLQFNGALNLLDKNNIYQGRLSGKLANGTLTDNLSVNLQKNQPSINMDLTLAKVDVKPVIVALLDKDNISGVLSSTAKLSTVGSMKQQWLANVNGTCSFNVSQGVVKGFDLDNTLTSRMQSNPKKSDSNNLKKGVTVFNQMSASATIKNGTLYNKDLRVESAKLLITGNGNLHLPTQNINFKLYLSHPNDNQQQLPLIIKGTLQKPKVTLDIKTVIKKLIKNKLPNLLHDIFGK